MTITTICHRIDHSEFIKTILMNRLPVIMAWIMPAEIVILALGCFVNTICFYFAAMYIFIVAPMILSLLYFNYALRKEAVELTKPHTVTFGDTSIRIDTHDFDDTDNIITTAMIDLDNDDIHCSIERQSIIFRVAKNIIPILIVPISAFRSTEDSNEVIAFLNNPVAVSEGVNKH